MVLVARMREAFGVPGLTVEQTVPFARHGGFVFFQIGDIRTCDDIGELAEVVRVVIKDQWTADFIDFLG